jgi:hypothetical protein
LLLLEFEPQSFRQEPEISHMRSEVLTAVNAKPTAFWDEMLCSLVAVTNILEKPNVSNFHFEDTDSKRLQNMVASYQTM